MGSLKNAAISGMLWSFCERFGFLSIQFITNIVLSRMLSPDDFGLIGMMMIFIALSNIFVDGGFGSALIQKKDPSHADYSTVFFINIILSSICYIILFSCSGIIAGFFSQFLLTDLLKILGLILIIDSFSIVQNNLLIKNLRFKTIAKVKISSAIVSSITAVIAAYCGLGVWSLVILSITNSVVKSILLWFNGHWFPSFIFSGESFRRLFGFGSKLLAASLLSELYRNFQQLVIGRYFSAKDLGFFTQAKQLEQIPVNTLMAVVNQVTYPVFSEMQNAKDRLVLGVRKSLKSLVFINFPLMVCLAIIAKPLILLLYTEKWLPSVSYFQLLCVGFGLLLIVHNTNLNILKAIGKSDSVLLLEIIKKISGVFLIIWGLKFGINGILYALALNSVIEFFLNGYCVGKYIDYGIMKQLRDIFPTLFISFSVGLIVYLVFKDVDITPLLSVICQSLLYISVYLSGAYLLRMEGLFVYVNVIKEKVMKNE